MLDSPNYGSLDRFAFDYAAEQLAGSGFGNRFGIRLR